MISRKHILDAGVIALAGALVYGVALAADTAVVTATVTVQNISVTVAPGTINYGTLPNNTASTTNPAFTQTATNAGNVAEDLNIRGSNSANWTLAAAAGANQYVHQFCSATCGAPPTNYTALTTNYAALATNIAAAGTKTFDLRIITPNPSSVFTQQSVDVTVQAVAH